MDFGDPAGLRALSSRLGNQGDDTELLHARISKGVASLAGNVSSYEHKSVQAFHARWDDVGSVLDRLVTDSGDVAKGLTTLASALDGAERQWSSAASSARGAGFSVYEGVSSATVTAPHGTATDQAAQDHQDQQAQQAADLERRMNDAARDAHDAQRTLRNLLGGISTKGLDELRGSTSTGVSASTGDASLDEDLRRITSPMIAVHDNLSRTA